MKIVNIIVFFSVYAFTTEALFFDSGFIFTLLSIKAQIFGKFMEAMIEEQLKELARPELLELRQIARGRRPSPRYVCIRLYSNLSHNFVCI